jgi:hypothetical protein
MQIESDIFFKALLCSLRVIQEALRNCQLLSLIFVSILAYWDCGFESRRGHGCLSLMSVVCCHVEVSATGWSLVQRSPTECGVSNV